MIPCWPRKKFVHTPLTLPTNNGMYSALNHLFPLITFAYRTLFQQKAKVSLFGKAMTFGKPVEEFALKNFESNAGKVRIFCAVALIY